MIDDAKAKDVRLEEQVEENGRQDHSHSPEMRSALLAFQQQQWLLASFDLSPILNLGKAISQSGLRQAFRNIETSLNFAALQDIAKVVPQIPHVTPPRLVEPYVIDSFALVLNFRAIMRANKLINDNLADFMKLTRRQAEQFTAISVKPDHFSTFTRQFKATLSDIKSDELRSAFERQLPLNFRQNHDLDGIAKLTLEEGLPLATVPRPEILDELFSVSTSDDRIHILDVHAAEIMDDCEAALNDITHAWADECRLAVSAFRVGLTSPAQSHASNIIDSIICAVLGQKGRKLVTEFANKNYAELPIRLAVENLVIRPLFRSFTKWFPGSTDPTPDHFSRHTTAHAVGQPGVFSAHNALVAVMLATSMTVQFWDCSEAP